MADETGFFRFDTNADAVATNIAGAMTRIQSSLAQGTTFDRGALSSDIAAMGQAMTRLGGDIAASQARVKQSLADLASGAIRPGEFQKRFQDEVRGAVRGVPQALASELALTPATTAGRIDAAAIGRRVGRDYIDTLVATVRAGRGPVADALRGMNFGAAQFRDELKTLDANPVAFGQENTRRQQLINAIRAERYIRRDGNVSSDAPASMMPLIDERRALAFREGRFDTSGDTVKFTPSNAEAELRELVQAQREAESAARRLGRAYELTEQQARELAAAERLLATSTTQRFAGSLLGPDGQPLRTTRTGVVPEENPVRVQAANEAKAKYDTEVANGRMLAQNFDRVVATNGYAVLDDQVFRLNKHGAERVQNEFTIQRILQSQSLAMARQEQQQAGLARRSAVNTSGVLGGFLNRIQRNDQDISTSFGGSIASAAAFSAAYGSIFLVGAALRDTLNEMKDYQDSMTDLRVATSETGGVTNEFANDLAELARISGANPGAALDTAARGIRAFGQDIDGRAESEAVGKATNRSATQLALIANKDLKDATGDLIATGSAFGLGPESLQQVVDAVANAKRTVGGDADQISQGLALIAGSAQEAGFGLNEAAAVIGLVQARTDQSGQAIATRLTRIFQITSGSTGKGLAREMGVDSNQTVKDQLADYADIYSDPNTSSAVKDRISSALGGTANLRELIPLLNENKDLQAAYEKALEATGQGTDEFKQKSEDLVGTLRRVAGTVSGIQVELGKSGLFAPFGIALDILDPVLNGVNRLLQLYNEIPGPLRQSLGLLVNIAAVSKAITVVSGKSAMLKGLAGGSELVGSLAKGKGGGVVADIAEDLVAAGGARVGAEATMNAAIAKATGERVAAERAGAVAASGGASGGFISRTKASTASRFPGLAALGGAVFNPVGLAVGGVVAGLYGYDKLMTGADQRGQFRETYANQLDGLGRVDGTSASLRNASEAMSSAAGDIEKSASNLFSRGIQDKVSGDLEKQSKQLEAIAARVATAEQARAAKQDIGVFGNGQIETIDQLAKGLDTLESSGASAITRLRLLSEVLNRDISGESRRSLQLQDTAAAISTRLGDALTESLPAQVKMPSGNTGTVIPQQQIAGGTIYGQGATKPREIFSTMDRKTAVEGLAGNIDFNQLQKDVVARAKSMGLKEGADFTDAQINELVTYAADQLDLSDLGTGAASVRKKVISALRKSITDVTGSQVVGGNPLLNAKKLTPEQALTILNGGQANGEGPNYAGYETEVQAALQAIPASDDGSTRLRVLRTRLNTLRNVDRKVEGESPEQLVLAIDQAEAEFAQAEIDRLEQLRVAAQNKGGSRANIRRIGMRFLRQQFRAAGSNVPLIKSIMERADNVALDEIEKTLRESAELARVARIQRAKLAAAVASVAGPAGGILGALGAIENFTGSSKSEKNLDAFLKARSTSNVVDKDGIALTGSDTANYEPPEKKKKEEEKKTAEERAQERADLIGARAAAAAARRGGGMATARAAITAARAQLVIAKKGTIEYFRALESFYNAQQQLRDAMVAYRSTMFQLRGDITDPVENARDSLRSARMQLNVNRRAGAGRDVIASDRLAVRQAQTQLESEKFNQRLNDVQTAEQLGKVSHARYIQYLENESRRLNRIKRRTRQQQDQLNTIDLALKDAREGAAGMFNLGDIDTKGLVYQVRRQKAEARAAAGAARLAAPQTTNNQTVTIQVNGADTAKVKRIVTEFLGVPPNQTQGLVRRKV